MERGDRPSAAARAWLVLHRRRSITNNVSAVADGICDARLLTRRPQVDHCGVLPEHRVVFTCCCCAAPDDVTKRVDCDSAARITTESGHGSVHAIAPAKRAELAGGSAARPNDNTLSVDCSRHATFASQRTQIRHLPASQRKAWSSPFAS